MSSRNRNLEKIPAQTLRQLIIFLCLLMPCLLLLRTLIFPDSGTTDDQLWSITVDIQFNGQQDKSLLTISRPYATEYTQLIQQTITHPGVKIRNTRRKDETIPGIMGVATKDGTVAVSVNYLIQQSSIPAMSLAKPRLTTKLLEKYLSTEPWADISQPAISRLIEKINESSRDKDAIANNIFQYTKNLKQAENHSGKDLSEIITSGRATILERSLVFVALTRSLQIPSRIVTGLILNKNNTSTESHYWAQVYLDDRWLSYDPYFGYQQNIPESHIPFQYNDTDIVRLLNGNQLTVNYSIEHNPATSIQTKDRTQYWYNIFDLNRLEFETRDNLAVLLLMPIGVFITTVFRHFIGIHSYGVFTPTLLALAITRNDLLTTFVTISVILVFSVMGRMFFPKHLSRIPRLSIIFTLVAIGMATSISIMDYYLPSPDGYAVLLPIVILTTLIDRFYKTLDENGLRIAYIRLFWTMLISLACIPVIQYLPLGHLFVGYPELHLLTLTGILIITHYKGNKLTRYLPARFREKIEFTFGSDRLTEKSKKHSS